MRARRFLSAKDAPETESLPDSSRISAVSKINVIGTCGAAKNGINDWRAGMGDSRSPSNFTAHPLRDVPRLSAKPVPCLTPSFHHENPLSYFSRIALPRRFCHVFTRCGQCGTTHACLIRTH
jgi:hypothetical protein